jgi:hypothetical protein
MGQLVGGCYGLAMKEQAQSVLVFETVALVAISIGRALHVELHCPTSSSSDWLKYLSVNEKAEWCM